MAEKRDSRGLPIRLGDEVDDEEATALDLSAFGGAREASAARSDDDAGEPWAAAGSAPTPNKRPPPPSVADDDPDKTEMIERPDLDLLGDGPGARGVVPLGGEAAKLVGKVSRPPAAPIATDLFPAVVLSDEAETVLTTRPQRAPHVRALHELPAFSIDDDPSDDKTLSRPKIARMTFRPGAAPPASAPVVTTSPPPAPPGPPVAIAPPRPLPPPPRPPARPSRPATTVMRQDTLESAQGGLLVVDAPPDAMVFIDGAQRGTGRVEVSALDRFTQVAIRVHRVGYKPWSRTVSLDGRDELRVVPELEPR